MSLYSENQNSIDIIQDYSGLFAQFAGDIDGSSGYLGSESLPAVSQSLVLDTDRGKLVKASGRVGKKGERSEVKSVAALKSHSEAERRRRERINAHLGALRGLVPSNEKAQYFLRSGKGFMIHKERSHPVHAAKKLEIVVANFTIMTNQMDKATLLAEVINQVKQLKETATQVSDNCFVPLDFDEVKVEQNDENAEEGTNSFRASICCEYRPGLLSDIRQALGALKVNLVRSEISTLERRVKNVFFFTASDTGNAAESCVHLVNSVRQALSTILDKAAASAEYSPRMMFPSKRRRVSYFESST